MAILNTVIVYDVAGLLKTESGSVIAVSDALAKAVKSLAVDINPVQNLNGYDSPWPAGGGKNLFDETNLYHGSYSASTGGLTASEKYRTAIIDNLPAGTYTFSTDLTNCFLLRFWTDNANHSVNVTRSTQTFTTETSGKVMICFRNTSTSEITETFHVQIELGSTATAYEPYANICPISGWSAVNVTRAGKNLIDDTLKGIEGNSVFIGTTNTNVQTSVSAYLPSGTYKLSVDTYDDSDTNLCVALKGVDSYFARAVNAKVLTFTLSDSAEVRIWAYKSGYSTQGTSSITHAQLELGSTATAYEPYVSNTYTIDLDGTRYGGTLDVTTGVLTLDTAIITVTTCQNAHVNYSMYRLGDLYSIKTGSGDISACNVLPRFVGIVADMPEGQYTLINSTARNGAYVYFCFADCRGSTQTETRNNNINKLTELQNAGTPMQLVYTLAEPQTVQLSPTTVRMLVGNNTLWADSGDSELQYWATQS